MFKLTIETTNAAFTEDGDACGELSRLLRGVSERVEEGVTSGLIRDTNGNRVGSFETTED